jgi:hypothetical protein
MPGPTDYSTTERIRQLKCRILASSINKSISPTNDGTTWLEIKVGREGRVVKLAGNGIVDIPGCCPTAPAGCEPLCDIAADYLGIVFPSSDITAVENYFNPDIVGTLTITPPPDGYPNDYFILLGYPTYCNVSRAAINAVATLYNSSGISIPITQYFLGSFATIPPTPEDLLSISFSVLYPIDVFEFNFTDDIPTVEVTLSNACSSLTDSSPIILGCFLRGTPVALANGSTKPIEEIAVGDLVIGAFGEVNPVLALHRPLLGAGKMCRINDEHSTTTHHPHISADRKFYCVNPTALATAAYGQKHTIIKADGSREKRVMTGVRPDRNLKLVEGIQLQTLSGSKAVTKIEPLPLSPLTQVYHLVVGGSHTYTVDGYAVVGWATETDFDYDTWTPK